MQEKLNKVLWTLVPILIIVFFVLGYFQKNREVPVSMTGHYFDQDVKVTIALKDTKKAKQILAKITDLWEEYDQYATTESIQKESLYQLNQNKLEKINLSQPFYQFLKHGKDWYQKSGNRIHIQTNQLVSFWEPYFQSGEKPDEEELKTVSMPSVEHITFENHTISSQDGFFLNLEQYEKGYTVKQIETYLKKQKITDYMIQIGSDVTVGTKKKDGAYKVALLNPNDGTIGWILSLKHRSIVTKGGFESQLKIKNEIVSPILDVQTKLPATKIKSVSVVGPDPLLCDTLASILFQMNVKEGKDFLKQYKDVDVIWTTRDGKIEKTNGVSRWIIQEK